MKTAAISTFLIFMVFSAAAQENPMESSSELTVLAEGFQFTEGPVLDASGNLYFSDIPAARIYRRSTDGTLEVFRENSGGANGLAIGSSGRLLACEGGARRVTAINPDGTAEVLADSFDGKKLNSPNDLWVDPEGGIYFTDPRYGSAEGIEQDGYHVFYIPADGGSLRRVLDNLDKPNGIIGTPDGRTLYVADHGAEKIFRYDILSPGRLGPAKIFAEQPCDGMALDPEGRLYATIGGVTIYSIVGEKLAHISEPDHTSNIAIDPRASDLFYVTTPNRVYTLRIKLP
jgi:gluconolactonase